MAGIQSVGPPWGCGSAAGQGGGPSCPSGAPLVSQGLSVPKSLQSHLSMARDTVLEVAELPLQKSCQNFGEVGNSVCSLSLVGLSEGLVLFGCPCVGSCSVPVEIRITIDFKNKKIQDTFISFLMLLCH